LSEQGLRFCVPEEMNPPLNVTLVTDTAGLQLVADFLNRNQVFCFDLETNVADRFYERYCRTIQIGNRDEQYVIDLLAFSNWSELQLRERQGWYRDAYPEITDVLKPALESRNWLKVGHNLEFDYMTSAWNLGIKPYNFFDTLLAEKKLYCGQVDFHTKGFWGLKPVVERYLKLQISKDSQTSFDLSTPLTKEQIDYAALDVRLPLAIKSTQYQLLSQANLLYAAQIEFNMIPASGDIHLNGMRCNKHGWLDLTEDARNKKRNIVQKLDVYFVPIVGRKNAPEADLAKLEQDWKNTPNKSAEDKELRAERRKKFMSASKAQTEWKKQGVTWEGEAALNYSSPLQLLGALRSMGYKESKLPDTSDQSLKLLAGDPVIDLIREYRTYNTLIDKFGEEWINSHYHEYTGCIHQKFDQFGAETGRSTSSKPNMQQIPTEGDGIYRRCFTARPGYKIITLDYAGQELRILAEYSQDPVWLKAFNSGWDLHSLGAEMLYGDRWKKHYHENCNWFKNKTKCKKSACPEHAKLRDYVKSINFGLAYGMGPKKLAEELGITQKEAKDLLDKFNRAFPVVMKYLNNSGQRAAQKLEARTLGQSRRFFQKPTWEQATLMAKRKRLMKKPPQAGEPNGQEISKQYNIIYSAIEREGKNTPIQGSGAEMVKLALGCGHDKNGTAFLWQILRESGAFLVNTVHDEIVIEAPEEIAETVKALAVDAMMRAGAELVKTVKMEVEFNIGDFWSK
jgi:DNA polymerase-1